MTAKDLLDLNGDFRSSPLLDTARKLHRLLEQQDIPYVIIGGLSVIRNQAVRTTQDVDLLVRREDWPRIREALADGFAIEIAAKDLSAVVELLKNNQENLSPEAFSGLHPRIRKELKRIQQKLQRRSGRSS